MWKCGNVKMWKCENEEYFPIEVMLYSVKIGMKILLAVVVVTGVVLAVKSKYQ